MSVGLAKTRVIRCPGCGGASVYAESNAYRPFCSARCKNHDFGAWASEGYSVAAQPDPEDPDSDADPQQTPPPH
jgi:endogenous inhibitor of DNA gyrase (YacG/DUF329 family)